MEIDLKIDDIFNKVVKTKASTTQDTSSLELKKLEQQMNQHLKSKQGQKFKKVSIFNFDKNANYDESTFSKVVDSEIEAKYKNKKWSSLPMYMKWKYVQEYLMANDITDNDVIDDIKQSIAKKDESMITFDHINKQVTNIVHLSETYLFSKKINV